MKEEIRVSILSVFRRQFWWLFLLSILLFAGSFWGLNRVPPIYKAKALINVEQRSVGIAEPHFMEEGLEAKVGNMVHFLKSNTLLNKTLNQLNYNYDTSSIKYNITRNLLRVKRVTPGTLIEISMIHNTPNKAEIIVNTLIEILMEEEKEKRKNDIEKIKSHLRTELQEIREKRQQLGGEEKTTKTLILRPKIKISKKEYLERIEGDIRYSKDKIGKYMTALHDFERKEIEKILLPQNRILKSYKPRFEQEEKKLINNLIAGDWGTQEVQNSLTDIWILKTKTVDTLKQHYNHKLPGPDNIKNALYIFYVKLYDLQIRKEQLIEYEAPPRQILPEQTATRLSREEQVEFEVLQNLEIRMLNKLLELESMEEMAIAEISWVSRAISPKKPFFPSLPLVGGLSLAIVLFFCFISICLGHSNDKKWYKSQAAKTPDN